MLSYPPIKFPLSKPFLSPFWTKNRGWMNVQPVTSFKMATPPKSNMEPENTTLEKEKHLQTTHFWVPCYFSGVYLHYKYLQVSQLRRWKLPSKKWVSNSGRIRDTIGFWRAYQTLISPEDSVDGHGWYMHWTDLNFSFTLPPGWQSGSFQDKQPLFNGEFLDCKNHHANLEQLALGWWWDAGKDDFHQKGHCLMVIRSTPIHTGPTTLCQPYLLNKYSWGWSRLAKWTLNASYWEVQSWCEFVH